MAASYPSSVKTWTPVVDTVDTIDAAHVNDLYEEVIAIETDLLDNSGWIPTNETWTYASASTITVASGATSRYQKGDKIKWTQTTVKYGTIVAVADTLLTIAINTDYVVANEAITANYISRIANPFGFPQYFNFTPTVTSAGGTYTTITVQTKYRIESGKVFYCGSVFVANKGTATGSMRLTMPATLVGTLCGSSMEDSALGNLGTCFHVTGLLFLQQYNGTTYWTNNYNVIFSVTYLF